MMKKIFLLSLLLVLLPSTALCAVMPTGFTILEEMDYQGVHYFLRIGKFDDVGAEYYLQVCQGSITQVGPPLIVSIALMLTSTHKQSEPSAIAGWMLSQMNTQLTSYFGSVPVTWEERFEAILKAYRFVPDNSPPQ